MKLALGIAAIVWLLCGVIGAWMLDDLDLRHWRTIALGPLTLVEALSQAEPVKLPG